MAAGTWIGRGDELKPARKLDRAAGARDHHPAILERLAQGLEHVAAKLGQLVEKEHAPMGERDLARTRRRAAAEQAGGGNGVMGRAKRARPADQRLQRPAARARDPDRLDRLRGIERWQQRRQPARSHRLARPRRADHDQAVTAGGRDLERVGERRLTAQIGEVRELTDGAVDLERQRRRRRGLVVATDVGQL